MAKRKRKQKSRVMQFKPKGYYPMAFCTKEEIPIAVSHLKCKKKVKVNWMHFKPNFAEFRIGYEFSMEGAKTGEQIYCPHCNAPLDFRMWMSDDTPHIVEFSKDVSGNTTQTTDEKVVVEEKVK